MANKLAAKKHVLEGLRAITLRDHLLASSIFSLFADGKSQFIPPTDNNYYLRSALHTPRTWKKLPTDRTGDLNWIGTADNVFVVVSIPRDKSEVNVQIIARELPSAASNYAFHRFIDYEDDDSQSFNSGIIGSPNVLGSVKLHWNSNSALSIEFVLQSVYCSTVLTPLKFPHPLLYMTLDSEYSMVRKPADISDDVFKRMQASFGVSISKSDLQAKNYEPVKFMVGLGCLMAITCYTYLDEANPHLPFIQFSSDLLKNAGFTSLDKVIEKGQSRSQLHLGKMIDLMRYEYDLFNPNGQESQQIKLIHEETKRSKDDHEQEKSRRKSKKGAASVGQTKKILIPLMPTDQEIEYEEQKYKEYYESTLVAPDPTPDAYKSSPKLIKQYVTGAPELTEEYIRDIVQQLQAESKVSSSFLPPASAAISDEMDVV